jgi:hypothetical protein
MPAAMANGLNDRGEGGAGEGRFEWVERDFDMD